VKGKLRPGRLLDFSFFVNFFLYFCIFVFLYFCICNCFHFIFVMALSSSLQIPGKNPSSLARKVEPMVCYVGIFCFIVCFLSFTTAFVEGKDHRDVEFEEMAEELAAKEPEGSPTNDEEDDLTAWEIGLISMTCFFFVLLLLMIILFLVLCQRGGGDGGLGKAVYVEDNEVSYKETRGGARSDKKLDDKVQVEFPDTNISLRQDHQDKTDPNASSPSKGRKHIMLNTTSTSTRDYR
jgi:hypothetical protein